MWVLSPIIRSAASQRPSDGSAAEGATAAAAATPNVNHFLIAGPLVLGRQGNVDILIHGDTSVSARHATLTLEAADGGGTVVVLTDTSSFGTYVNDAKLTKGQPRRLAADDSLRFSARAKFRLSRAPITLHVPLLGHVDEESRLTAEAAAAFDLQLGPWGPDATHCIVPDGGPLGAAALAALVCGASLVTRQWLDALRKRKVWSGELPPVADYAPRVLMMDTPQGPRPVDVGSWQVPREDLLSAWTLVVRDKDQALCEVADFCGANRVAPWAPGSPSPDPGPGRTLLGVLREGAPAGTAAAATDEMGVPHISCGVLIAALVGGDEGPLRQAVAAFEEQQRLAAVEGTQEGTQGTQDKVSASEDEGEVEEVTLLDIGAGSLRRRAGGASSGSLRERTQPEPQKKGRRGSGAAAAAAAAEAAVAAAGTEAATPSPAKRGKAGGGGKKRAADHLGQDDGGPSDAPAAAAKASPASKRPRLAATKGVAGPASREEPSTQQQQQQQQQQVEEPRADSDSPSGGVVWANLVVASLPQAPGGRTSSRPGPSSSAAGPNYKAFRPKGQASAALAPAPLWPLTVYADGRQLDDIAQAFAKEEQQRAKRIKKADELFNANIIPSKPGTARPRKK